MEELEKLKHPFAEKAVKIETQGGKWLVTVIEAGKEETSEYIFQNHAEAFAAGQRQRLGLQGTTK